MQTNKCDFAEELIRLMEDEMVTRIIALPFLRELMEGCLDQAKFRFYLMQDVHFLRSFSKVFTLAAAKINITGSDEAVYLCMLKLAQDALDESVNVHQRYFQEWGVDPMNEAHQSRSCLLYTSYLLSVAQVESLLPTLCACLPCYYLYYRVAQHIANVTSKPSYPNGADHANPYQMWINSYSSNDYKSSLDEFLALLNKLVTSASSCDKERCIDHVRKASQMEYLFWDSAYKLEKWPLDDAQLHPGSHGPKCALTIAGSDSGGGAGIQADLSTFHAHHVFGTSAVTALTAQNSVGVQAVFPVSPGFLADQIESVLTDINVGVVKTGMLYSSELIRTVVLKLKKWKLQSPSVKIVVDPVMISTSGHCLLENDAIDVLVKELFPLADVVTPNMAEARRILEHIGVGFEISNVDHLKQAAKLIVQTLHISAVLVKGGHLKSSSVALDVLYQGKNDKFNVFEQGFIQSDNTHGTGCSLSAAIASNLLDGMSLELSIHRAKLYVHNAIFHGFKVGKGHGTLNHRLL